VLVVLAACILNAVSTISWNSLDCLSTESFPTALRTTALGVLAASGRLGSIVAQFVFGALIDVSVPLLLTTAAAVLGAGALSSLLLPREVKGAKLGDTVDE
jgi:VNT family MFS transporter (synaptic vesicle glycoprotein 2)